MMENKLTGYSYFVDQDRIEEYCKWTLERRLRWLYYGNKLRKSLPEKTIQLQERFRKAPTNEFNSEFRQRTK